MFVTLSSDDRKSLMDIADQGFIFDWTQKSSEGSLLVSFISNGDIAGLVEFERQPASLINYLHLIEVATSYRGSGVAGKLLAYVAKDSLEQGFEGFVVFESKTVLIDYYIEKYGAKRVTANGRRLYFDAKAANLLISKYLGE